MKITDKKCPFRKFERESSLYKRDEEFQYCLIVKPILHQEVEVV